MRCGTLTLTKHKNGRSRSLRQIAKYVARGIRKTKGYFPITWTGIIFLCLAYVVWYGEVTKHYNQILYASVSWLLAVFVFVFVITMIGVLLVSVVTRRSNRHIPELNTVETGQRLQSGYRIYRPAYLPFIQIEVCVQPDAPFVARYDRKKNWIYETVTLTTRGRYERLVRTITVRDMFGISAVTFDHEAPFNAEIRPCSTVFDSIQFAARASGEGYSFPTGDAKGELVEMRRYQAGDPLRYILWRVFARSRKLLVRAPEPAVVEEQEMFLYFIAGQKDDDSASLTRSFLTTFAESDTDLHFCADGSNRVVHNAVDGVDDVIESVRHRAHGAENMLDMIKRIPVQASRHCFMMVPQMPGPWLDHVRQFCVSTSLKPCFVMAVKAGSSTAKKVSFAKRLFCDTKQDEQEERRRMEVCTTLAQYGEVQLVDIDTGAFQPFVGPVSRQRRNGDVAIKESVAKSQTSQTRRNGKNKKVLPEGEKA